MPWKPADREAFRSITSNEKCHEDYRTKVNVQSLVVNILDTKDQKVKRKCLTVAVGMAGSSCIKALLTF